VRNVDIQIKNELQTNAHRAFELLYRGYFGPLCLHASRFFDDKDEAQEVVQRTLVHLWSRREELKTVESLRTYLFRSVHNTCLNTLRSSARKTNLSAIDHELLTLANDCDEPSFRDEQYELVTKAIAQLPPQCRKILELNRIEGFTYKEIAQQLNISHRTVDSHLTAAMKFLREKLNPAFAVCIVFLLTRL